MPNKIIISIFYAFAFTIWPPDNGQTQVREKFSVTIDEYDSSGFYELQEAREDYKQMAETTRRIQRKALKNLNILESKKKPLRIDTLYVVIYDTLLPKAEILDTPHKRTFFDKIFNRK